MRNRSKVLHISSSDIISKNGNKTSPLIPIYNSSQDNGIKHSTATETTTAATTRKRFAHTKQYTGTSSSSVCGYILLASICFVALLQHHTQHLRHPLSKKNFKNHQVVAAHQVDTSSEENIPSGDIIYDIVILGAGPAGLTAAIFGTRAGLNVLVLGSQSGLLAETPRLENFPGYFEFNNNNDKEMSGEKWLQKTRSQARSLGAHFGLPGLMASSLEKNPDKLLFAMTTQLETYHSKSVIVATGATSRRLNLSYEDDLWGNHIHNCAICDGHMYKDRTVVVVGGGDASIDAALYLSRQAKQVFLIHRRTSFDKVKAQSSLNLALETPNIDIFTPYAVIEWKTSSEKKTLRLTGVVIQNTDNNNEEQDFLACDGAFLMIGATPNTAWLLDTLDLHDDGLIRLNSDNETNNVGMKTLTSVPGVFAAGEVIDTQYRQAITAAAAGAQAALDAERWLRQQQQQETTTGKKDDNLMMKPQTKKHRTVDRDISTSRKTEHKTETQEVGEENLSESHGDDDDCDLTNEECIQKIVENHPVVVFSKPWCPYCRKALEALALAGLSNPYAIDLSQHSNTLDIQRTLQKMTGRRTVPNVFVGAQSIGGGDETVKLQKTGELKTLLEQASAIESTQKIAEEDDLLGPPPNGDYGCNLGTEECITKIINKYPLVLFSLSWCPECHRMFELLALVGISKPHVIDLDDYPDIKLDIRQQLLQRVGTKSVPSLFVKGEALEGFIKVSRLHQAGELVLKLENAGIL